MGRSIGNTGLVAPATGVAIAAAVGFGLGLSQTMLEISASCSSPSRPNLAGRARWWRA
ncbi:hypothetical protein [Sphingomonas phyllosphaerae]|uniref:hypothetical protein n=1 Tax=Sphingomonas phyllosphaerae TaxID=257003 RepID=UPI0024135A54|nr:hypothetical protein [Sphingomonas phyllosphaerae]